MSNNLWKENINKLKAYHKKFGNYNVPTFWKSDPRFAKWVENIRKYPNRLQPLELRALKRMGFSFKYSPDWDEMYSQLEKYFLKHGHAHVSPGERRYETLFDWTVRQRQAKSRLSALQVRKLDSLAFDWTLPAPYNDSHWETMYQELKQFRKKYGHVKVPQYFKENKALGNWVSTQRRSKTEEKLSKERIKKLNALGFLWKEDIARMWEDAWEKRYWELIQYKKKHGHTDRIKVKHDHFQLGLWIETQMNTQHSMSADRKKKLNAIGFKWDKGDFYEDRWNEMYNKLKAYKKKHGHCRVKQREDFKLSVWIQRNKRDREIIDASKRKKLEQLGVKWPHQLRQETWESRYQQLKKFRKENGNLDVPKTETQLYEWIQTQKGLKRDNKLPHDREQLLMKLNFIWTGELEQEKTTAWKLMYNKFKALKEKNGSRYHLKLKALSDLDKWVQRQLHNKDKLSAFKKKMLDAIGFQWNPGKSYWDERWEEMYDQLKVFKAKFGHCNVPQKFPENQPLASWVNGQRTNKDELPKYRTDKLNNLGFSWANEILDQRWMNRVREFEALKAKGKHLQIPAQSPLGCWIYYQKKRLRLQSLPPERKRILVKAGVITK